MSSPTEHSGDQPLEQAPSSAAPSAISSGGERKAASRFGSLALALLVVYALALGLLALDEIGDFGWFPTKLERRVRQHIGLLLSPDQAKRNDAMAELRRSEAFVVIPELIRQLDAPSSDLRQAAFELLQELTYERLHGKLFDYRPSASTEELRAAQQRLWDWWKSVEEDF